MPKKADWKTVRLDSLLTDEQIKRVSEIIKKPKSIEVHLTELRRYFTGFRKQLEDKGVLPEYLAAVIAYNQTIRDSRRKGQHEQTIKESMAG
jgi:hypothetical protein